MHARLPDATPDAGSTTCVDRDARHGAGPSLRAASTPGVVPGAAQGRVDPADNGVGPVGTGRPSRREQGKRRGPRDTDRSAIRVTFNLTVACYIVASNLDPRSA